jgi:hypothetical protein
VTDFGLPPFDARIKAQFDAQREQLKALSPVFSPAQIAALRLASHSPQAQQTRKTIAAWRQDIADREKDLASRQEGLRELEAYAEHEYGIIPAPRPAPIGPPLVDPPIANPRAAEAINDNGAAAAASPSEPEPQRLRGRPPKYEWLLIGAKIAHQCLDPSWRPAGSENVSQVATAVLSCYELKFKKQPPENSVRDAVSDVCKELSQAPKLASGKKPPR